MFVTSKMLKCYLLFKVFKSSQFNNILRHKYHLVDVNCAKCHV